MGLIKAWSFSRWAEYNTCPYRLKLKAIDKLKEPESEVLKRGSDLHLLCEHYLRGITKTISKDLKPIAAQLKALKKAKALPEAEFTFTAKWERTRWDDWTNAWCRIKADALVEPVLDADEPIVEVHDFKSGGKLEADGSVVSKEEYPLQLRLYALAGLLSYPAAKKAHASLIFIDHGKTVPLEDEFTQKDVKVMKKEWETRTKAMLNDTQFKPKPGNNCRWCHFRKANGGPCEY